MLSWNCMRIWSRSAQHSKTFLTDRHKNAKRYINTIQHMNALFDNEKKRQKEAVGRIEKIDVDVHAPGHTAKMEMNKDLSTPYDCARHLSEHVATTTALATIDETEVWDMHRPLEKNCALFLRTCLDPEPQAINQAFWRTCSFLLASMAQRAFKDTVTVLPHSFPRPNVLSGSFVSFIELSIDNWQPNDTELRRLSKEMITISEEHHFLERLVVSSDLALEIFANNPHKIEQIPSIVSSAINGKVTLYRAGTHIDISKGPMVSHTGLVGRCSITAVHPVPEMGSNIYRFQGVALFKQLYLNHFGFKILEDRASKPNVHVPYVALQ